MWKMDTVVRWHRGTFATFHRATCSVCGMVGMVARGYDPSHLAKSPCYTCSK